MSDERPTNKHTVRAKITAIDKTLAELQDQLERGLIDIGRYTLLKADWERKKAELEAQSPAPFSSESAQPTSAVIRELLTAAFSDEELTTFCYDYFRPVYEMFAGGMSKGDKAQRLIEYCERRNCIAELLSRVQQANPGKYKAILG